MNINQLKQSNFLTRHDVGSGMLLTIKGDAFQENVAKTGAPEELRWCLAFEETEKPFVLNSTNGQIIASITGSHDSENWHGHKIVLYDDPNVSFGGKLVGGIRARAPRQAAPAKTASRPQGPRTPEPPPADDTPF